MKKLIAVFVLLSQTLFAQEQSTTQDTSYWKLVGNLSLNLSQVNFSNWAAGGENAVGFSTSLNYSADYQKAKVIWRNRLELAYGLNQTESDGVKKTNDKIYFSSTYGYEMVKELYASASVSYNSQFYKGYDYTKKPKLLISDFMSPGYVVGGLGATWKPKAWFTATLSAVSWRGTFVMDDSLSLQGLYGVDKGDHLKSEIGGNLLMEVKTPVMKNIDLYSRLELFSNYEEEPQNVDVRWDLQLTMKVNEYFSAKVTTNMIYDDNTKFATGKTAPDGTEIKGARLQFKELLEIGMMFSF